MKLFTGRVVSSQQLRCFCGVSCATFDRKSIWVMKNRCAETRNRLWGRTCYRDGGAQLLEGLNIFQGNFFKNDGESCSCDKPDDAAKYLFDRLIQRGFAELNLHFTLPADVSRYSSDLNVNVRWGGFRWPVGQCLRGRRTGFATRICRCPTHHREPPRLTFLSLYRRNPRVMLPTSIMTFFLPVARW